MKGKKSSNSKSIDVPQENANTGPRRTRISQEEMARSNFLMDDDEEDVEHKPKRKNSADNYDSKSFENILSNFNQFFKNSVEQKENQLHQPMEKKS